MNFKTFSLIELFQLAPGAFHATGELEPGAIPLVSCGWENNGIIGHYDIPEERQYSRVLTVAFNGAPLTTHFHPYRFGAKDDVAVLQPRDALSEGTLIYVAAILNGRTWRYSYGRKCYREKLERVTISMPAKEDGSIDDQIPNKLLHDAHTQVRAAALASIDALLP